MMNKTGHIDQFQISEYLLRIGIIENISPDIQNLKKLHKFHLLHVPFENLDIFMKEEISLNAENLYRKIVIDQRGGFCYELNTIFYYLLRAVGYKGYIISARVYSDGKPGPEFDHMALIVEAGGKQWLCDVGFGDSFIEPLEMVPGKEQKDIWRTYKITMHNSEVYILSCKKNNEWTAEYIFTLKSHQVNGFLPMCRYHQTSSDSHFTQKIICTIATESGRVTLRDNRLIITEGNNKKDINYEGEAVFIKYLYDNFGILLKKSLI
jgi:N-hydroxyarylamine O-acetyltransferase